MATVWTDRQQEVIDTRGRNILVSAAAGSGKTAVLVERIIQKIIDKEKPIDVDRLLVVTFTKAAASEMRERIFDALTKIAEKEPDNNHIQKQLTYIHNAKITTIDSFCSAIFKEHFDRIDVDPNIRIVEKVELAMLESDVLEEMFEEYYSGNDEAFFKVADTYNNANNMDQLEQIISKIYSNARAHINPERWLQECKEVYNVDTVEDVFNSNWMGELLPVIKKLVKRIHSLIKEALEISQMECGPKGYIPELSRIFAVADRIVECENFDDIYNGINMIEFDQTIAKPGDCDGELKLRAQALRNESKKRVAELKGKYLEQKLEGYVEDLKKIKPIINTMIDLTSDFMGRFNKAKNEKGIIDFIDMEHFALSILVDKLEDGSYIPSKVARDISTQFEEIMIDEYQDSNYIQDAILSSVSKGADVNNIFMVGDVKQSIYKFRQATPELFIEKYNSYQSDLEADNCKIILDKNFRSRKEIINSVNYIFGSIMGEELGGIEYTDGNQLVYGATYPELPKGQDNSTEVILLEGGDIEKESKYIANKIWELVDEKNGFMVSDGKDKMRKARFRDIVILLRGTKGNGEKMAKYLNDEGINAYCQSSTGYYDAIEVKMILDYLSIIDNPLQDIPLAAVISSEMYNFSAEDMAKLKSQNRKFYLYDSLTMYLQNGSDEKLLEKVAKFHNDLSEYRRIVPYTNVYDLIVRIIDETGYGMYVSAMPGGSRRIKNLEILKEKAITYATTTYKGLFNFIRYIEKIKELELEEGEATEISENDDIVRIMTFHKSKGLQFPIVFVSELAKDFNMKDIYKNVIFHEKYGIGVDVIDEKLRVKSHSILKTTIKNAIKEDIYAESVRLLYVAMTRAQEKMFLTGSIKDASKSINGIAEKVNAEEYKLSAMELLSESNYLNWILLVMSKNKSFLNVANQVNFAINDNTPAYDMETDISVDIYDAKGYLEEQLHNRIIADINKEALVHWDINEVYDETLKKDILSNLSWKYPYSSLYRIPAKLSVTEIKKLSMHHNEEEDGDREIIGFEEEMESIRPNFLKKDEEKVLKGAERGTAYHRVFELFDFNMEPTYANIENMLIKLLNSGKISRDIYECINIRDFEKFAKTSLYERMRLADKDKSLYRERSFLMGVNANELEIYKDCGTDEMILVQGIIDACFVENNKYVIVDYKTDKVDSLEELVNLYKAQLISYKEAIEAIDDTEVGELIIYSVKFGAEINIPF